VWIELGLALGTTAVGIVVAVLMSWSQASESRIDYQTTNAFLYNLDAEMMIRFGRIEDMTKQILEQTR